MPYSSRPRVTVYEMPSRNNGYFHRVHSPFCSPLSSWLRSTASQSESTSCALSPLLRQVISAPVLLILLYLCVADLQPSCPDSTHRVTIAIWYPRRSNHRTNCAHFSGQKPPRCCCGGSRGTRPSACRCIREETWHSKGLWRSGLVSKYEGVTLLYQCECANHLAKNYWMIPRLMLSIIPYGASPPFWITNLSPLAS